MNTTAAQRQEMFEKAMQLASQVLVKETEAAIANRLRRYVSLETNSNEVKQALLTLAAEIEQGGYDS